MQVAIPIRSFTDHYPIARNHEVDEALNSQSIVLAVELAIVFVFDRAYDHVRLPRLLAFNGSIRE
jgi:hypothetical protein